ncbi:hypothetical protein BVY04_01890 [bacterium M21]|nr:hypothetical protein BVY04_01890 [bacterium M21]
MKLAISGKGGVGKSTLAAAFSMMMAQRGRNVLAVDADPDANLAGALGMTREEQDKIIPISEQKALVEERTGAKVKQYGQMFKLNPEVADIADTYAYKQKGVSLVVLGAAEEGGGGCACPESVLLRALVTDLVLFKDDALVMDMEAGVEHLGRATVRGVDVLLIVVEPGQNSIDCANRVIRMAAEIGLTNVQIIANKVESPEDEAFIRKALPECPFLGAIPYVSAIRRADRDGQTILDAVDADLTAKLEEMLNKLEAN